MLNVDIQFSPSFAMATVKMNQGESVRVEAGAMSGMSGGIETKRRRRADCSVA